MEGAGEAEAAIASAAVEADIAGVVEAAIPGQADAATVGAAQAVRFPLHEVCLQAELVPAAFPPVRDSATEVLTEIAPM